MSDYKDPDDPQMRSKPEHKGAKTKKGDGKSVLDAEKKAKQKKD